MEYIARPQARNYCAEAWQDALFAWRASSLRYAMLWKSDWVKGYDLRRYPGLVHQDGVEAMIRLIMRSKEPVTLVCISPMPNIGEALKREPRIARKARFVGMHGSLNCGHHPGDGPVAEHNVVAAVSACQRALSAPWDKTITPLDTCAKVRLTGRKYRAVAKSTDPLARLVMENQEIWKKQGGWLKDVDPL